MRRKPILAATILLTSLSSVFANTQPRPFLPAETANPVRRYHAAAAPDGGAAAAAAVVAALFARATSSGCISGTFSCADQGSAFDGICCANGQSCALDSANSPACCPSGDVCTGTAPSTYRAPSTTTTTAPVSYVSNQYFSFPYIVTSFSNAAACSRAVSQCGANYEACTANLEGSNTAAGGGRVSIVVGGTTTVTNNAAGATTTYATSSATSICSSLSSVACFGIQTSYCTAGSEGDFTVGSANSAARPTGIPCVGAVAVAGMAAAAAAAGFGMAGI